MGRAAAGCSNHNSVRENAARKTLEQVIKEALSRAGKTLLAVLAICLGVSGVNHPSDQERVLSWIRWTNADSSWARIAALVPLVVSCAESGDQVADKILNNAVQELALSVKVIVRRLHLAGEDGNNSFPVAMAEWGP